MKAKRAQKMPPSTLAAMTSRPGVQRNIIRYKRNGKPTGIRTTNAQIAERVVLTAQLLCRGAFKYQIHHAIIGRYGVHWRTADNYIVRARELLLSNVQKTRDELVADSYGFYCSVLRDSAAATSDKLRAQQRIDDLFSLEQPRQVRAEITGANGAPFASPQAIAQVIIVDNGRGDRDNAPLPSDPHNINLPPALPPPAVHVEPVSDPKPETNGAGAEPECLPGVVSAAEFLES